MKFTNLEDFNTEAKVLEFRKLCVNNANFVIRTIISIINQ